MPKPIPFWPQLLEHIEATWRKKLRLDAPYPWPEKKDGFWRHLETLAELYQPWGVMAMWDLYLGLKGDKYVADSGYSVRVFFKRIEKLLDHEDYRGRRETYEAKLYAAEAGPPVDAPAPVVVGSNGET